MNGNFIPFRKQFLGGFNQQDVADYIRTLAQDRNAHSEAKDEALRELQALTLKMQAMADKEHSHTAREQELIEVIERLHRELENAKRVSREFIEQKVSALESAEAAFSEFDSTVADVCSAMKKSSERVNEQFEASGKALLGIQPVLQQFQRELDGLREILDGEKGAAYGGTAGKAASGQGALSSGPPQPKTKFKYPKF